MDEETRRGSRILVVDDKERIREMLQRRLESEGYEPLLVDNGEEALHILDEETVDLVLLDIMMPEFDGFQVLEAIRDENDIAELPVIMLTARSEEEDIVRALDQGANDYLTKPVNFDIALARVRTQVELKKSQEKIRRLARRDRMTGLLNRTVFIEELRDETERSERYDRPVSLLMMDIDHFKDINDEYGHLVGDRLLEQLAELLQEELRRNDFAGRYGGEEFGITLPETGCSQSIEVAERYRQCIKDTSFEEDIDLTVSMGIATYGQSVSTVNGFLKLADTAMYHSKRNGRDQANHFSKISSELMN